MHSNHNHVPDTQNTSLKWETGYGRDGKFTAFCDVPVGALPVIHAKLEGQKLSYEINKTSVFGEKRITLKGTDAVNAVHAGIIPKPHTMKLPAELSEKQKAKIIPPLKLLFNEEMKKQAWHTGYTQEGRLQTSVTTSPELARKIFMALKAQKLEPAAIALSESEYKITLSGTPAKLAVLGGLAPDEYKGKALLSQLSPARLAVIMRNRRQQETPIKT